MTFPELARLPPLGKTKGIVAAVVFPYFSMLIITWRVETHSLRRGVDDAKVSPGAHKQSTFLPGQTVALLLALHAGGSIWGR